MNRIFLLLLLAGVSQVAIAQDVSTQQLAARTEIYPIQTLTLSDAQFLKGESAGATPVTTTGVLRIAQGSGRLPVVILQHGSSGIGGNVDMWSRELNGLGISTFTLDGFTGRGLKDVGPDQASLGRLNFILDIYRALEILAHHPRVDTNRIALMGFSRGGQAALFASLKRFHRMWNKSGVDFAAYLPFYPDCMTTYISDTEVADRPIRIFGAGRDDYDPIAVCKSYVERLKAAGRDVELTVYPTASHSFDNPIGPQPPLASPNAQTVRNCRIKEAPEGVLVNAATSERFTYNDACVERGPHMGHDPAATRAARDNVENFLRTLFKLQ